MLMAFDAGVFSFFLSFVANFEYGETVWDCCGDIISAPIPLSLLEIFSFICRVQEFLL